MWKPRIRIRVSCVLQKVKIIDDRLILIKLSRKPLFSKSKQYFSGSMRAFIRIYIYRKKLKNHIRIMVMLLKLDTYGAIYFLQSFWTLFNLFLMDSAAKILLKYVKNIISRGISTSSIQLDPKFGQKNFVEISNCRHIRFLLNGKKVDLHISAILRQNKIPDIGFDRAKSALQKPLSH